MFKPARQRALHVWIALLAILFSALAPALSQAVAAPAPFAGQMEICTMDGIRSISPDDPGTGAPPSDHFQKHCSICLTHPAPPALLPPTAFVIASAASVQPWPPLFYQAPHALFPWTAASPRAPPAFV
jgi:Protein of unknown function (DUF2946)